ncbi:hypothetical protein HR12_46185, partial [Microbacterium sp. SUBG005]
NGAGKSTILKIMAGLDTPSNGEARLSPGFTVGILMQEPELDDSKTVLENIQDGVAIKPKLDRFNEISALMADPDADFDALLAEMGTLQEEIDAADGWDLDSQLEQRWTLCGRPLTPRWFRSPVVSAAAWRWRSCCCRSPTS